MPAPTPIWLYHFTRLEHLVSIARNGLCCDADAHQDGRLLVEIGNVGIKEQRRHRSVRVDPGGVVADYAAFYYAPRSPMLFAIKSGNVATYAQGQAGLIYLCTTLAKVRELSLPRVATDRNAALITAAFATEAAALDDLIDWPLMSQRIWSNTPEDPQRRERRQAELLVHRRLPWDAIQFIGTRTSRTFERFRRLSLPWR